MIRPVRWKTRHALISDSEVRAIHDASLRVMERTGLEMPLSQKRREQAEDLDLKIDQDLQRICFPPAIVEAAIRQAPHGYALCARDPDNDVLIDGEHGYLALDGCGTDVFDLDTAEVRPSTRADLEAAVRVADALPQIAFLWPAISARLPGARAAVIRIGSHVDAIEQACAGHDGRRCAQCAWYD